MEQFIVSARKYRPATFNSVIGQSHITETLKNAIARNQLAHAYLFTGPRGVGKTTCARIFAKAINCLNPTADHEACGMCESCVAFNQGRSFSIHELDAASNNSVDDIRALNEKVRIPPQVGRYSVYIIDEVHMLSAGAFNAFLKTLEEPPHYAIFILATTEKHKILPTILSRCQCYDFNRIRVEDTVRYLEYIAAKENVTADDESLHIIAQRADGGMRDALSMFDRVVSFCGAALTADKVADSLNVLDYNTYFAAVEMFTQQQYPEMLTLFDGILRRGFDGQLFIAGLCSHLRDLLVCKNPQTAPLLEVTGAIALRYQTQAAACDIGMLFNAINLLTQADTTYRSATNKRLHAELALIKLCGLKKKYSSDSVDTSIFPTIATVYPMPKIEGPATVTPTTTTTQPSTTQPQPTVVPRQQQPPSAPTVAPSADATTSADSSVNAPTVSTPIRSVTGISISSMSSTLTTATTESQTPANETPKSHPNTTTLSPEETQRLVEAHYDTLVNMWQERQRPRIATALTSKRIEGRRITIIVSSEVLSDEINQFKWEIERDIRTLTGTTASIEVEITDVAQSYRPVSIEDKLKFLVELNPNIVRLRDELDLTV